MEAAGGSVVVTSPESDQKQRDCEMAAKLRERKIGRELGSRGLRKMRDGVVFLFKGN